MEGTYPWFDYDRDYLQPEEPRQVHDPDEWVFRGGQWIYVGDNQPIERERYEDNAYWRKRYLELCYELGEIINEQQDLILALKRENKRLKRENWNLKQTKRRKK